MTPLPFPIMLAEDLGRPDGERPLGTAGQPDDERALRYTAGGVPVFCFEYGPAAPIWLVTISYDGTRRRAYVIGRPHQVERIARFAAGLGITAEAQRVERIDAGLAVLEETLP